MRYFDCHCDTLYRMETEVLPFSSPRLHVNLGACQDFPQGIQVFALWSDRRRTSRECWHFACQTLHKYQGFRFLPRNILGFFSVEDGRLLEGQLERLQILRELGVFSLIPFWKGENELGGGWDTEIPLSPFGRAVIRTCLSFGIHPDISHASLPAAEEILWLSKKSNRPVLASHVGARSICPHGRNLPDELLLSVASSGGLIGLDLVSEHLASEGQATVDSVAQHLFHFLSLGIEGACCLGSDFDGCDSLPRGITGLSSLPLLSASLSDLGIPTMALERFFYNNGAGFIMRQFPSFGDYL